MHTRTHYKHRDRDAENHETLEDYIDEIITTAEAGPKSRAKIDYTTCSTAELFRFIKDRTGQPVARFSTRENAIAILGRLDQDANCPFLELVPELRNLIYDELLCHNKSLGLRAYPAILRTCKQVYHEGKGILAALSTARFDIILRHTIRTRLPEMPVTSEFKSTGDLNLSWWERAVEPELPSYPFSLDFSRFRRVENLTLKIKIWTLCGEEWALPGWFFGALVDACKDLRKVDVEIVEFRRAHDDSSVELVSYLKPLLWLPSTATLRLRGLTQTEEDMFWAAAAQEDSRSVEGSGDSED